MTVDHQRIYVVTATYHIVLGLQWSRAIYGEGYELVFNARQLAHWRASVSTLTRDIDTAIMSVCPSVRLSIRDVPVSDENGWVNESWVKL